MFRSYLPTDIEINAIGAGGGYSGNDYFAAAMISLEDILPSITEIRVGPFANSNADAFLTSREHRHCKKCGTANRVKFPPNKVHPCLKCLADISPSIEIIEYCMRCAAANTPTGRTIRRFGFDGEIMQYANKFIFTRTKNGTAQLGFTNRVQ